MASAPDAAKMWTIAYATRGRQLPIGIMVNVWLAVRMLIIVSVEMGKISLPGVWENARDVEKLLIIAFAKYY